MTPIPFLILSYLSAHSYLILSLVLTLSYQESQDQSHMTNYHITKSRNHLVIQLWHHYDIIGLDHDIIMTSSWHHCWLMNSLTVLLLFTNSQKTQRCALTNSPIVSPFSIMTLTLVIMYFTYINRQLWKTNSSVCSSSFTPKP